MYKSSKAFDYFDSILVKIAPSWYRRPVSQSAALGGVFLAVFTAYTTLQFYASTIYGEILAANSVSAVYATFTITCIVAPSITNKFGSRMTMMIGIFGYAVLVLCSLAYFWNNQLDWIVVLGGTVLGCGAALLWTAQGRLILDYAAVAEELAASVVSNNNTDDDDDDSNMENNMKSKKSGGKSGEILSVFWAVFQCSALIGGAISFAYYNTQPKGSTMLYLIFLGFILLGAFATKLLLPPETLLLLLVDEDDEKGDETSKNNATIISDTTSSPSHVYSSHPTTELTGLLSIEQEPSQQQQQHIHDTISTDSWLDQAKQTFALFKSKPMLELAVLFFYTGLNQPYQQATFGNRFFTRRTIGVELIIFHIMEILGAIYCGKVLDNNNNNNENSDNNTTKAQEKDTIHQTHHNHRHYSVAIRCLTVFVIVNTTGNCLAFWQEYQQILNSNDNNNGAVVVPTPVDISDPASIIPSIAFACWGFADSQIQVYCYWLLGLIYKVGDEHSRSVGFYKCVQSLGVSIGYYLIPTSRVTAMTQLILSTSVFVLGTALSLLQLPT